MATDGNAIVPSPKAPEAPPTAPTSARPPRPSKSKRKRAEKKAVKPLKVTARSDVWAHFEKFDRAIIEVVDGKKQEVGREVRAKCRYCETDLAGDSSFSGTSTLRRHIEIVCKKYPGRADIEGQQVLTSDGMASRTLVSRTWTEDACKMIVVDELPFSHIEKPGFRHFCEVAIPHWTVPSRRAIVRKFLELYDEKKEELKMELSKHRVCLTTDTWTSVQNVNYMVLTAHFIDNGWKMHKRILNFCVISNHQGTTIGKMLETCLVQWKIDKVLTVSVDNASANKVAIDYLRRKMANWAVPPVLGGKHLHVRCLAHILNLIVKSGLAILDRAIASIRNAVKYVRSSSSRLDVFKLCVEREVPECTKVCILDVPTRWNSTYLMLETAIQLKKAFDRLAEEEDVKYTSYFDEDEELLQEEAALEEAKRRKPMKRVGPPKDEDWERAELFVGFLKVFYSVTLRISASTKPTAHRAFHDIVAVNSEINALFRTPEMQDGSEGEKLMVEMAVKMGTKFRKYFDSIDDMNQLLLVALVLDPRYKLRNLEHNCVKYLQFDNESVKRKSAEVKELLVSLTDLYASSAAAQNGQKNRGKEAVNSSSVTTSSAAKNMTGKMAEMLDDWERELENSCEVVVESEVDRYLLDPFEKPPRAAEFSILLWWKLNGSKYPNLQLVAKDVFAIQVSTVASESCFSTGNRVIDPYRSSLTPKSVEALICLQNWIKSENVQNIEFFPTIEEMEFYELCENDYAKEKAAEQSAKKAACRAKKSKMAAGI
ncbi:zinc finger BED domain-containing protein RICESLEEPER 2-like [Rosa sericea]